MQSRMSADLALSFQLSQAAVEHLRTKQGILAMMSEHDGQFRTCHVNWIPKKLVFTFFTKVQREGFLGKKLEVKYKDGGSEVLNDPSDPFLNRRWYKKETVRLKVFHLTIRDYPPPLKIEDLESWLSKKYEGWQVTADRLVKVDKFWMGGARARILGRWLGEVFPEEFEIEGVKVNAVWQTTEELIKAKELRGRRWEKKDGSQREDGSRPHPSENDGRKFAQQEDSFPPLPSNEENNFVVASYELGEKQRITVMKEFKRLHGSYKTSREEEGRLWMVVEERQAKELLGIFPSVGKVWPISTNDPGFFTKLKLQCKIDVRKEGEEEGVRPMEDDEAPEEGLIDPRGKKPEEGKEEKKESEQNAGAEKPQGSEQKKEEEGKKEEQKEVGEGKKKEMGEGEKKEGEDSQDARRPASEPETPKKSDRALEDVLAKRASSKPSPTAVSTPGKRKSEKTPEGKVTKRERKSNTPQKVGGESKQAGEEEEEEKEEEEEEGDGGTEDGTVVAVEVPRLELGDTPGESSELL